MDSFFRKYKAYITIGIVICIGIICKCLGFDNDLIIAALGLLITFYQIKADEDQAKAEEREKAREEEIKKKEDDENLRRNQIIREFTTNSIAIKEFTSSVEHSLAIINCKYSKNNLLEFIEEVNNIINSYSNVYRITKELYYALLSNESVFSLSYGFDRYIRALREFYSTKDSFNKMLSEIDNFCNLMKNASRSAAKNSLESKESEDLFRFEDDIMKSRQQILGYINSLYTQAKLLEPFVEELQLKYQEIKSLDQLLDEYEGANSENIRENFIDLVRKGQYLEAELLCKHYYEVSDKFPESEFRATVLSDNAYLLLENGDYEQSVAEAEKSVAIFKGLHEKVKTDRIHQKLLNAQSILAKGVTESGDYESGKNIAADAIRVYETKNFEVTPAYLKLKDSLATALWRLDEKNEWIELENKIQEQRVELSQRGGVDDYDLLSAKHISIMINQNENNDDETKERYLELIKRELITFGLKHPRTLASINNLAITYRNLDDLVASSILNITALKNYISLCGIYNPRTLRSVRNLALDFYYLKQYHYAYELDKLALGLHLSKLGPNHKQTLFTIGHLTDDLRALNKYQEAYDYDWLRLEKCIKYFGSENENTIIAMEDLAFDLSCLKRYQEAYEYDLKALELRKDKYGPEDESTINVMHNLGCYLRDLNKYQEAYQNDLNVYHWRKANLGPKNEKTIATMCNMVNDLDGQYDYSIALKLDLEYLIQEFKNISINCDDEIQRLEGKLEEVIKMTKKDIRLMDDGSIEVEEDGHIVRYDYIKRENIVTHEIVTLGRRIDMTTGEMLIYPLDGQK